MRLVKVLSAAIVLSSMLAAPALAATCNPPGGFDAFLAEFKKDAAAKGVSPRGLSALNGVTLDPNRCSPPTSARACSSRPSRNSPAA